MGKKSKRGRSAKKKETTSHDSVGIDPVVEGKASYVKAIEDPPPEQYCARCLRKGNFFCSICRGRSYCSEECQQKDLEGHKQNCTPAPSQQAVKKLDICYAGEPKHTSRPMDASPNIPTPQIPVGTSVICRFYDHHIEWIEGVVQRHWYYEQGWPKGNYAPYQVRLINGIYMWIPEDNEGYIRRNTRDNWIEVHHANSLAPSYVKAIEDSPPEAYCSRCIQKGYVLCSICQARSYCSEECQQKDWKQHKHCCEEAPSKKEVKKADFFHALKPKYSSRPMDASPHIPTSALRFPVGTSVICEFGGTEWSEGVVQCHWYREHEWPKGLYVPYQVRLINGNYIFVETDSDDYILLNTRDNWIKVHPMQALKPSYVKATEDPPPHKYCTRCLNEGKFLCSRCQVRPYCSKECQGMDWNRHKHCCMEAPSKELVKREDINYSNMPKHTSRPADASHQVPTSTPQFPVGTSVLCQLEITEWVEAVVQRHWYRNETWPEGVYAPYQLRLINGTYFFLWRENKDCIRRNTRDNWIKVHHRFDSMSEAEEVAKRGVALKNESFCFYCGISENHTPLADCFEDPTSGQENRACVNCISKKTGCCTRHHNPSS